MPIEALEREESLVCREKTKKKYSLNRTFVASYILIVLCLMKQYEIYIYTIYLVLHVLVPVFVAGHRGEEVAGIRQAVRACNNQLFL